MRHTHTSSYLGAIKVYPYSSNLSASRLSETGGENKVFKKLFMRKGRIFLSFFCSSPG